MAWSLWTKRLVGTSGFGLAALTVLASSCAEAEARFFIECTQAPDGEDCGCDAGGLSEGSYNTAGCTATETGELAGACGYSVSVVFSSGMTASLESPANLNGVETGTIIIDSVDISFESTGPAIDSLTGLAVFAPLTPGGSACVEIGMVVGDIGLAAGEYANVIATVKGYGRTTGGLEVETPEVFIPFTVYNEPSFCSCDSTGDGTPGLNGAPITCITGCETI